MRLSEAGLGKSNNLQFIRFVAAIGVIFGHAFYLSTGEATHEWLMLLSGGRMHTGTVAVRCFFLCGGYLTAKSLEQSNADKFFSKRLIRLIPPLFFVNLCVCILGMFLSTYSPLEYFSSVDTWKYLLNSVFVLVHDLPGVFTENTYLPTVNGSLWTLPVEFLCYIACFVLYRMTAWKKRYFAMTVPLVLILVIVGLFFLPAPLWALAHLITPMILPCLTFYIGIGFWIYRDYIVLKSTYGVLALAAFAVTILCGFAQLGTILFFPYAMFTFWFGVRQRSERLAKLGDYSYGIYLWGWPVQQTVTYFSGGGINPYINIMISVPTSIVLGMVTFYAVERPVAKAIATKL